jgi:hypothetical protein
VAKASDDMLSVSKETGSGIGRVSTDITAAMGFSRRLCGRRPRVNSHPPSHILGYHIERSLSSMFWRGGAGFRSPVRRTSVPRGNGRQPSGLRRASLKSTIPQPLKGGVRYGSAIGLEDGPSADGPHSRVVSARVASTIASNHGSRLVTQCLR